MKVSSIEPGVIVSGVVHVGLLLATLVVFSDTPKFEDAQETVPVEIITDQQFNQIAKGEKEAKKPAPTPARADKPAEVEEKKPPARVEAKVDVPTPPPPLKRRPDPEEEDDDKPDPKPAPTPPRRVAARPPEPPVPEPPKPVTRSVQPPKVEKPEPPKPRDAEAIEPPKPPQKPKPEPQKAEVTPPTPPTPPKVRPAPKEPPAPKAEDKPSLDKSALAKLLEAKKAEDKPAAKPKSGDETSEPKPRLDRSAVASLLSREPPGQKPSTSRAPAQTASLGSPTANAPKMSPSLWGQLDGLLQEQYKQCWSYLALGGAQRYIPQIKVEYSLDGSLVGQPALLNPPGDPALSSLAESAVRAVRKCNPLKIPAQFAPFHQQWRNRTLRFDPEEMAG